MYTMQTNFIICFWLFIKRKTKIFAMFKETFDTWWRAAPRMVILAFRRLRCRCHKAWFAYVTYSGTNFASVVAQAITDVIYSSVKCRHRTNGHWKQSVKGDCLVHVHIFKGNVVVVKIVTIESIVKQIPYSAAHHYHIYCNDLKLL